MILKITTAYALKLKLKVQPYFFCPKYFVISLSVEGHNVPTSWVSAEEVIAARPTNNNSWLL